jgi:hypothetical protein
MVDHAALTGEWTLPGGHRIRLLPDGTAAFTPPGVGPSRGGSWRYVGDGRFETVEAIPPQPEWGHNPGGYDDLTHYRVIQASDGRIVVVGFGGGEDGLERDPVTWSHVSE